MYCIASSRGRNLKLFNIEKLSQVGVCRSVMAYKAFPFFRPSVQAPQAYCIFIWEVKAKFSAAGIIPL